MSEHIFISYSHKDSAVADILATTLHRAGIPIFIDKIALHPGESLTSKIGHGLQNAKALIVLLSKSSVSSEWVLKELNVVKTLNIPIVPFLCDKTEWPIQIKLLLGDPLYLDGGNDFYNAIGIVPKLFPQLRVQEPCFAHEQFFPLRGTEEFCPYAQIFNGTLQTALEEKRFGRIAVVLPTNPSVDLTGKVTTSFLNHLGISAGQLLPLHSTITSRQATLIKQNGNFSDEILFIASTVFNPSFEPHAEDQWRAAIAVLDCAEQYKCSLVLAPPMGTGGFDWPVCQAVVNWLYGAIRWCKQNITVTNRSVWPMICVPGPGDQKILRYYLDNLTKPRLKILEDRKLSVKVRYDGKESDEIQVNHDVLLGSIAKSAFSSLKVGNHKFRHGKGLVRKRTGQLFEYDAGTPLAKTIFADSDVIEVY